MPGKRATAAFGQRAVFPWFAPRFVFAKREQGLLHPPGPQLVLPERDSPRRCVSVDGLFFHGTGKTDGTSAVLPREARRFSLASKPCDFGMSLPFSLCWPLALQLRGTTPVELAVCACCMWPLLSWLGKAGALL